MSTITIIPRGPFSLLASTRFLEGFAPARYRGSGREQAESGMPTQPVLRLAFPVEGSWATVGASVTQRADGVVVANIVGPQPVGAREQLARILSLDVDGSGLDDIAHRDPVVADLTKRYSGLRPVCFYSPYEAACWAVIGNRIRIAQAAAIKGRVADIHGEKCTIDGVRLSAFPDPRTLLRVADTLPLPQIKIDRLRGIAAAALDGLLACPFTGG